MKRITPADVVDAYIATGMGLLFGNYSIGNAGCGLSAVCCLAKGRPCLNARNAAELLDVSEEYCLGFSVGFDGFTDTSWDQDGLADGKAARAAVTAHFAKAPAEQPQEEPAAC
jgi:hypothetical protein